MKRFILPCAHGCTRFFARLYLRLHRRRRVFSRARFPAAALSALLALFLIGASLPFSATGESFDVQALIDNILAYRCAENDVRNAQEWLDTVLTAKAGTAGEWSAIALSQSGSYDFTRYRNALLTYLSENTVSSASTRQKIALALCAVGGRDEPYIGKVMNDSIGEQGVMSLIFGLHLLNNGFVSDKHTADSVIGDLLNRQCSDGGWALTGDTGDVDVTAMALSALAVWKDRDERTAEAINRALSMLSSRQTESGDFVGYDARNAESTAQVLTAMSSLGIDCRKDERFYKNGNGVFEGLALYRHENGGYIHKSGDVFANNMATEQVFYALIAYRRMLENRSPLFVLDAESLPCADQTTNPAPSEPAQTEQAQVEPQEDGGPGYKVFVIGGVLLAAAAACVLLIVFKKRNRKNFLFVALIAAALIVVVLLTNFESVNDYHRTTIVNTEKSVTFSVRCDTVAGKKDEKYTPKSGVILDRVSVPIKDGDTVYDALLYASKKYGLPFETSGAGTMIYIRGINYINEFDFGDLSGWIYRVNGVQPSVGCALYTLRDKDEVTWLYSIENFGGDV